MGRSLRGPFSVADSPACAGEDPRLGENQFSPELLDALKALEEVVPLQEDLETTLTKIVEVSIRLLPGCDSASVSLVENGEVSTPAASDDGAVELDDAQYRSGRGPCLDAIRESRIYMVEDTREETRWPEFCRAASALGIVSSLSIPLRVNGTTGGLNLYGRSKNGFAEVPNELADLLSSRASMAIENAKVYGATRHLVEQLQEAIKTREIIGEAKGILMEREGVGEDEAFQMLITVSQNTNTKLRDIAQKMVGDAKK